MLNVLITLIAAALPCPEQAPIPWGIFQPLIMALVAILNALAVLILAQVRRNGGRP